MSRVLPILFNGEMVQTILDGWKTATRRIVKPQPKSKLAYCYAGSINEKWMYPDRDACRYWNDKSFQLSDGMTETELSRIWNPPCHAGDILYVRETWAFIPYDDGGSISDGCFVYRTDYGDTEDDSFPPSMFKWRPSIHMPKQAARIWLKVTYVRVEHLQDMNTDDFLSEGVTIRPEAYNDPENAYQQARAAFIDIWDSTIKQADRGKYGWAANPWVWVIEFERCEKPEE